MNKLLISLLVSIGITGVAQAAGNADAGKAKTAVCAACHGADGNSALANFPKLAGQNEKYLLKQLKDIKSGARPVVEMTGLLDNLSDQDMADISAYFAKQKIVLGQVPEAQLEAGQTLYRTGVPSKGIAACTACHSPNGLGIASAGYPALSGQHGAYIESQLNKFRKGDRANDPGSMMRDIAGKMSDAEIKAVSAYVQGLH